MTGCPECERRKAQAAARSARYRRRHPEASRAQNRSARRRYAHRHHEPPVVETPS